MSEYMDLKIESRSGKVVIESLRVSTAATTDDLKQAIFDDKDRKGKYSPVRQRLTLPPEPGAKAGTALGAGQTLKSYGLETGAVVQYKDLGMQVSYKLVFVVEYLGPLLIYPFFWTNLGRNMLHGVTRDTHPTTLTQDLALAYWSFHYAKRIFETGNVHVFSHATMPIFNLFRNSMYYWAFAAFVSFNINHPQYTDPWFWQTAVCFVLAYVCQAGNFYSHVVLAGLRKSSTGYSIPRGGLFNIVTCANYTYEIWGWMLFTIATQSLPAAIFGACGAFQMIQWAIAKHKRLKKLFDGQEGREKYPRRYVILPPFL